MEAPTRQPLDMDRERSRRASIQDLAVDLGGPSVRERGAGVQWPLLAVAAAAGMILLLLQV